MEDLIKEAEKRGYVHGNWVLCDDWPNTPLRIGFGLTEYPLLSKPNLVIGCVDKENNYYTAPIFIKGKWAKLIKQP